MSASLCNDAVCLVVRWLREKCRGRLQPRGRCLRKSQGSRRQGGDAYAKNDFDLALKCFTDAIRLKPDYAEAYCNRGDAYGKKGDRDKAIADYTEAVRLKPDYPIAYYNRGAAYGAELDCE